MGDPKRGWGAIYNDGTFRNDTGANALIGANDIGVTDSLRERALDGEVAPGGPDAAAIASGNARPWDWGGAMETAESIGAHAADIFRPGTDSHKGYMDAFSGLADWIPEDARNAAFGQYDRIMKAVKDDWDRGGGGLNPMSRNNYFQQLIDAGASNEVAAQLLDKYGPTVENLGSKAAGLAGSAYNTARSMWNRAQQGISSVVNPVVDKATGLQAQADAATAPNTIASNFMVDQGRNRNNAALTKDQLAAIIDRNYGQNGLLRADQETDAVTTEAAPVVLPVSGETPTRTDVAPEESSWMIPRDTLPTGGQFLQNVQDISATTVGGIGTPMAIGAGYSAWKNAPKRQIASLQSQLDANIKSQASSPAGQSLQDLKVEEAKLRANVDEINARGTRRSRARDFVKKHVSNIKVSGGKGLGKLKSGAKTGLKGLAIGGAGLVGGAALLTYSRRTAASEVPMAIEAGHLPGDALNWTPDEQVEAIYTLSKMGDISPDFAERFDMASGAGDIASSIADELSLSGGAGLSGGMLPAGYKEPRRADGSIIDFRDPDSEFYRGN